MGESPQRFESSTHRIMETGKYIKKGLSFGATSGVITVIGLISGLAAGTHSKIVVVGGIITIAIADSLSDALGMHTSEESSGTKEIYVWITTFTTLVSKFVLSITFLFPVFFLDLDLAVIFSGLWGALIISLVSLYIAKEQKTKAWKVIAEHLAIAVFVLLATGFIGRQISRILN